MHLQKHLNKSYAICNLWSAKHKSIAWAGAREGAAPWGGGGGGGGGGQAGCREGVGGWGQRGRTTLT